MYGVSTSTEGGGARKCGVSPGCRLAYLLPELENEGQQSKISLPCIICQLTRGEPLMTSGRGKNFLGDLSTFELLMYVL